MQRFPFSRLAVALGLALLLGHGSGVAAGDEKAKSEKVRFDTSDGIELQGTFWPSDKGKKAPCAILLHRIGGNRQEEGWDTLAQELQKQGIAVLAFDFRGHGDSTTIKDPIAFWKQRDNQSLVRGYNPGKLKDSISFKDYSTAYYPYLANDLAAAKLFLDSKKNDGGECNTANLILIGAEDGAVVGSLWLASEFYRYRLLGGGAVGQPVKLNRDSEGSDVMCAIWLSMPSSLGNRYSDHDWITFAGKEKKVPMLFAFGEGDEKSATTAHRLIEALGGAKNLKVTGEKIVKGTKLTGNKLMSKGLDTEQEICKYIAYVQDNKSPNDWDNKEVKKNTYVWASPSRPQQPIPCKTAGEDTMQPLPFTVLGLIRN